MANLGPITLEDLFKAVKPRKRSAFERYCDDAGPVFCAMVLVPLIIIILFPFWLMKQIGKCI